MKILIGIPLMTKIMKADVDVSMKRTTIHSRVRAAEFNASAPSDFHLRKRCEAHRLAPFCQWIEQVGYAWRTGHKADAHADPLWTAPLRLKDHCKRKKPPKPEKMIVQSGMCAAC